MIIHYSQTINQLDAYLLSHIDKMVGEITQYKFFSILNLTSVYHQVVINPKDNPYTAFEACRQLYQFLQISFGIMRDQLSKGHS